MTDYAGIIAETAAWIDKRRDPKRTFCFGVSGAQGSGKSTFSRLLGHELEAARELSVCILALDDFYRTRVERSRMAREIHPLLQTRGVPGTHDMALMNEAMYRLRNGLETKLPRFDKAADDRSDEWTTVREAPEVLIVEGWCWGARPVAEADLETPLNELEARRDADGTWRRYVNQCLAGDDYQVPFDATDALAYLVVPGMDAVFRWRLQQETELERREGDSVMDEDQIREFIMYYERITLRMLDDLPGRADIALYLDDEHGIETARFSE